jgi:flagellar hook assembly protein FlgD
MQVAYQLARPGLVDLVIYDAAGRAVRTLVRERHAAGYHTAVWNGTDAQGRGVPSGIYFIRFTTDDYDRIEKAVLLK